MMQTEPESIS